MAFLGRYALDILAFFRFCPPPLDSYIRGQAIPLPQRFQIGITDPLNLFIFPPLRMEGADYANTLDGNGSPNFYAMCQFFT